MLNEKVYDVDSVNFESDVTIDDLVKHIPGPDFPTGGVIYDAESLKEVYSTGRGRIFVRGVAEIVEGRQGRQNIIISELPYQVNKAELVKKIAELVKDKKIAGIADLRDESDKDGMRVVIELKRASRPKSVLNNLYKLTKLQTTFPANFVALIGQSPQILNLKNFIVGGHAKISQPIPPLIQFKNVSFKYPESDNFVFKNLNLVINSKEEIAIVGINGAGKSTLIKLICNFYQPTSGEILINGVNLDKIDLKNWYHQLSYLAQEFNNYWNLNLRENIEIGNPKIKNISKIISSLQKSDAMFYKKYKKGLETPLSPRYGGEEPSWGQWQKIAIARTFYRNAPIIILDEPTASIDAVSEFKIFKKLYQQITGKTLIIVSHRFSTVRNAQRIIVIDKGKIVESGSHQQLIKLNGLYAKSFKLQAKGYTQVD